MYEGKGVSSTELEYLLDIFSRMGQGNLVCCLFAVPRKVNNTKLCFCVSWIKGSERVEKNCRLKIYRFSWLLALRENTNDLVRPRGVFLIALKDNACSSESIPNY